MHKKSNCLRIVFPQSHHSGFVLHNRYDIFYCEKKFRLFLILGNKWNFQHGLETNCFPVRATRPSRNHSIGATARPIGQTQARVADGKRPSAARAEIEANSRV